MSCALAVALFALAAAPAHAADKGWSPLETFGSVNQPVFGEIRDMAVHHSGGALDGDVLVYDHSNRTVSRWNPDGSASNFAALGTNVIDGLGGVNCPAVPADCDRTPGNAGVGGFFRDQVAVDSSGGVTDGNIYVTSRPNKAVDVFSSDGEFLGQLTHADDLNGIDRVTGVGVDGSGSVYVSEDEDGSIQDDAIHRFDPSANPPVNADRAATFPRPAPGRLALGAGPSDGYLFSTGSGVSGVVKIDTTTGAQQYGFGGGFNGQLTVDPTTGDVLVSGGNGVVEYDASGASAATVVAEIEDAGSAIQGIAVGDTAQLLYLGRNGVGTVDVWEAVAAPDVAVGSPSFIGGAKATVTGTVGPQGQAIVECFFQYGKTTAYGNTVDCDPAAASIPADFASHQVSADLGGLLANGTTYHYRLVVRTTAQFPSGDATFTTADTFVTNAATAVTASAATLNGTVKAEGLALTECRFEYGQAHLSSSVSCSPPAGSIPSDDSSHAVSASLTGLEPGSYRFRLVAENAAGQIAGDELTFTIAGRPRIELQAPANVGRTAAVLQARVNPAGAGTTYRFEWGTDAGYGSRIPAEVDAFIGSGTDPVTVTAPLDGLAEESVYHFRVVATNSLGTTTGQDRAFSTLNDDGLAWGRRYELVSPPDKGAVGEVGVSGGGVESVLKQASPDGEAIAYNITFGLEDATAGAAVHYRADRGPSGWLSTQLSPSVVGSGPVTRGGQNALSDVPRWLSRDLGCGFRASSLLLTDDPEAQPIVDAGAENLYRANGDGSYDLATNVTPADLEDFESATTFDYPVVDAAEDCSRVIFSAAVAYPGVPFTRARPAGPGLYEWNEGTLGNPSAIPGPSGPQFPLVAIPGAGGAAGAVGSWNALSDDGSRFYFTATSALGGDVGKDAIFLREDGEPTVDVSQSQTATPNNDGSRYQLATPDGAHVFFIARYGLAPNGSSTGASDCVFDVSGADGDAGDLGVGCDLYRYSVDSGELVDLSPSSAPGGAGVAGVLDASEDGSRVYFAAKGQLVADKGQTHAQNTAAGTRGYNVYLSDEGDLSYVTTVAQSDVTSADQLVASLSGTSGWASRTTPDGGHLVFQSAANLTGHGSGGGLEAYRYSADSEDLECVSCRRDGQPGLGGSSPLSPHRRDFSAISADGSTVFFSKADPLAPGANPGDRSLYEWREGQTTVLVSQIPGGTMPSYYGAGANGASVFFDSQRRLTPWDVDGEGDLYVARVGGGLPPPPEPVEPCDPLTDGSCQGPPAPAPAPAGARTTAPAADGNAASGERAVVSLRRPSRSQRRRAARSGVVRLRVRSNRAGMLRIVARARLGGKVRRVGRAATRLSEPGATTVRVKLSRAARRQLRRGRRLSLSIRVRASGARPQSVKVALRRAGR